MLAFACQFSEQELDSIRVRQLFDPLNSHPELWSQLSEIPGAHQCHIHHELSLLGGLSLHIKRGVILTVYFPTIFLEKDKEKHNSFNTYYIRVKE